MPRLVSVNVGQPRPFSYRGKTVHSSIWKEPVEGRVAVRGVNIGGDDQADRRVHGGRYKAVYAYSVEDYAWWHEELGKELPPGTFGENLTIADVDMDTVLIGERWRIADVVLEVTQPRFPCYKLGHKMGTQGFVKRFARAQRPGTYLAIETEGDVGAGDEIEVISRPSHDVTIGLFAAAYLERDLRPRLLAASTLEESWRAWAMGTAD
jgi:MOSC domain-containing protein YiiM